MFDALVTNGKVTVTTRYLFVFFRKIRNARKAAHFKRKRKESEKEIFKTKNIQFFCLKKLNKMYCKNNSISSFHYWKDGKTIHEGYYKNGQIKYKKVNDANKGSLIIIEKWHSDGRPMKKKN